MKEYELAVPTAAQQAWQDLEVNMFVHFLPRIYKKPDEPKDFVVPLDRINPDKFDAEQWVNTAHAMGARMIVLVAKHDEGFSWWQTQTSDYGIKEIKWRNGKGDLVKEVSHACRAHELKMGIYLSPADQVHHAAVGGRCVSPEAQEKYNEIYRQQLTELLSRYGEISEVWFDGSLVMDVSDILKRYAPDAMIFQSSNATIRWVGNEEGCAPYPAWNSVRRDIAKAGVATAANGSPEGDVWLPIEVDTTLHENTHWHWQPGNDHVAKSLDCLLECYYRSVGHGAVLLLNNAPDPRGLIPETDARRCGEFGSEIRRRFGRSLAEIHGQGMGIELPFQKEFKIDHIIIMEDIASGERVRSYVVEGLIGGQWSELSKGTAIGHKKIDFFKAGRASAIRMRILESKGVPLIRRLAAFHAGSTPTFKPGIETYVWNGLGRIGPWSLNESDGWKQFKFDIAGHVAAARQYLLEFVTWDPADRQYLEIQSVNLMMEGVELGKEFVTPTEHPHRFQLNITAAQSPYQMGVAMRCRGKPSMQGEVVIHVR